MRELAHARSQWAMQVEEARIRAIHLRLGNWFWYVLALREQSEGPSLRSIFETEHRTDVRYVKVQGARAAAETIYHFMKGPCGNARRDFVFYGFLLEADAAACYHRQLWTARMAGATIEPDSMYSP
ncbi:MAG TPA: hypothetical protein VNA25_24095 [Phycisphaerae bacterium]|nr:hypothetical protein [Phycisphaerae bacterium]